MNKKHQSWLEEPSNEEVGKFLKRLHALTDRILGGNVSFNWSMESLQMLLDSKKPVAYSLLPSPAVQLGMFETFNQTFKWNLTWKIDRLRRSMPRTTLSPHLAHVLCFQLVPRLLLEVLSKRVGIYIEPHILGDCENSETSHDWEVLDFSPSPNANFTVKSFLVANPEEKIPGGSMLWALICNPNLLSELGEFGINSIWIPGIIHDQGYVLKLAYDEQSKRTEIRTGNTGHGGANWCIPKFV